MTVTPVKPALDLVEMFPDLFEGLDPEFTETLTNIWAMQWHEGWTPDREDLADFIAVHNGVMTREEASLRAGERVRLRTSR